MGRSFSARVAGRLIPLMPGSGMFKDTDVLDRYIEARRRKGPAPCPGRSRWLRTGIETKFFEEMEYFVLGCGGVGAAGGAGRTDVLYFHGGGYVYPPMKYHRQFLQRIARETGARIWVPLYPRVPFADAEEVYRLLLRFFRRVIAPSAGGSLLFVGDSAGGGLALGLAQAVQGAGLRGPGEIVLISPWLDAALSDPRSREIEGRDPLLGVDAARRAGRLWAGDKGARDPAVSPLYGDLAGLGRLTLFSATRDILNPDSRRLAARAEEEGLAVRYYEEEGLFHVYPLLPVGEARRALAVIEAVVAGEPGEPGSSIPG